MIQRKRLKPKIVVFAGPNGSGKSTISANYNFQGEYINADVIKAEENISDIDAAKKAEALRESALAQSRDFAFETVLSTERNLLLLNKAKENGYFIRGYYVLTCDPQINVLRVKSRKEQGGHDVPEDKIISRYKKTLALLPEFIKVCDICSVYDNSLSEPCRIYKKHHGSIITANEVWSESEISKLVFGIC